MSEYDHVMQLIESNASYINWLAEKKGNVAALDLLDLCRSARAGERVVEELRRRWEEMRLRSIEAERHLEAQKKELLAAFRGWVTHT